MTKALENWTPALPLTLEHLEGSGEFSGYASVFDVIDSQQDVITRGAFRRTLANRMGKGDVRLLWQHKSDMPIGQLTALREDSHGLYVEGKLLLDIQPGKEAYSLLKSGAIEGMSIGYSVVEAEYDYARGIRLIYDLELWEISLVTFPANSEAKVTHIKGEKPETMREFEKFLREQGFSRSEAKTIAAYGFTHGEDGLPVKESKELCHLLGQVVSVLGG